MRSSYVAALEFTLNEEGGYSNHPADKGGPTMKGVTKRRYEEYLGRPVTIEELKKIPFQHLGEIYKEGYWDMVWGDELPKGLDAAVFDYAVNSGPDRAARYLQRLVGAAEDGKIGPKTLAATERLIERDGAKSVIGRYIESRRVFMRKQPNFKTFPGWIPRTVRLEDFAKGIAG
jgi:lysozyme family protein